MSFTASLRKSANSIWVKEQSHVFVKELGSGELKLEVFQHYMKQDYQFLIEFSKVIAVAVAKCGRLSDMEWFSKLLNETLNVEMSLHVSFCKDFGISLSDLLETKMSPTVLAYTRYLLEIAYSKPAVHIATAILPCSWGYSELGKKLHLQGMPVNAPLYCRWIEMYNSEEFAGLAQWLRDFIDRETVGLSSESLVVLSDIFIQSSRYEYLFWDAAYRMETWHPLP
jgi:thiaminase/transcriptional activator TenA|tara:strand:- start:887 stop:1561 length:675 start_codon:yes stop_codon:yes gene_type:complete